MTIYDTVIIGGGPAGLSAGLYAARAGLQAILLEKSFLGGQAVTTGTIENYPGFPEPISGFEIIGRMEEQVRKHNLPIEIKEVKSLTHQKDTDGYTIHLGDGQILNTRTVIVATGALALNLDVPGEKEFTGRGVSYCATCDGPLFREKEIMVVGGGNSALEEAIFLARFGRKVSIIHRRDALRGDKILQNRVFENPKIHVIWNSVVKEIKGDSVVKEIVLYNRVNQSSSSHKIDGLFIYIGTKPNTAWLNSLITLDSKDFIIADEKLQTNLPGLFAAGDCRQKELRQIVTAAGDGAIAGMMAYHYLQEKA